MRVLVLVDYKLHIMKNNNTNVSSQMIANAGLRNTFHYKIVIFLSVIFGFLPAVKPMNWNSFFQIETLHISWLKIPKYICSRSISAMCYCTADISLEHCFWPSILK